MTKPQRESAAGALPPTGAGLIRYFDEDTQGVKLSPKAVVIGVVVFGVLFILLHTLA
ncbi:MAG: preprotein translocase subunit Sec61beta [Candidatus Methanofastidiosa archaeon]|jgi:preprotein translocase subunit Sec61beta|nr:preprotein translocase subunit Sec61beta [Candidatus Methanofastidiosa archaeon]MDD4281741.1 preprotein translocase subunit Sec61beta [Candidatus Methanofastidiosa archaeon]